MPYAPFYDRFKEIAEEETRSITVFGNHSNLPNDTYGLVELYCDEPGCDCRRVMFNVISEKTTETVAVIAYGWENEKFYKKWMGEAFPDPNILQELKGPCLNLCSAQSKLAPALLETIEQIVLLDHAYIDRIPLIIPPTHLQLSGIRPNSTTSL